MVDIFQALGWLNEFDGNSRLTAEMRQLSIEARSFALSNSSVKNKLERLRLASQLSADPLEKAEILLHCAAIRHVRGWFPQAASDAEEAASIYTDDDHRRAVALWILGTVQWEMQRNHKAFENWARARKLLKRRQVSFQHLPIEANRYKSRIWQMDVELAAQPEGILTWLNKFEGSSLRKPTRTIVDSVQQRIRQQAHPNVYTLMQDFQTANKKCRERYEQAEVYLMFGLTIYQLGKLYSAIDLLRKAVEFFYSGMRSNHKQVVARCMLGAVEWKNAAYRQQAITDWRSSLEEFEDLRQEACRDNHREKMNWYARHRALLHAALSERLRQG